MTSGLVRLYPAIVTAGRSAALDLHEGMIHVVQQERPDTLELRGLRASTAFLNAHLPRRAGRPPRADPAPRARAT